MRIPTAVTLFPDTGYFYSGEQAEVVGDIYDAPIAHRALTAKGDYRTTLSPQYESQLNSMVDYTRLHPNAPLSAFVAQSQGTANAENIAQIQLVNLLNRITNKPDDYFDLERAAFPLSAPKLELREAFMSAEGDEAQELDRGEEAKEEQTKYTNAHYILKKLVVKPFNPIEDMMRAMINPQQIDIQKAMWRMRKTRNQLIVRAVQKITRNATGGTTANDLGNLKTIGTGGFHSTENAANTLQGLMQDFTKRNHMLCDTVIMSSKSLARWVSNTWVRAGGPTGIVPARMPAGGSGPLPGMENVTVYTDINLPDNQMWVGPYNNMLRAVQGPQIMRRYYDENRHAEVIAILDFFKAWAVDDIINNAEILDRYHAFKCTFTYS